MDNSARAQLVEDLPVQVLVVAEELELAADGGEVSVIVDRERAPGGVAAEVPRISRPAVHHVLAVPAAFRRTEPGDERLAEPGGAHDQAVDRGQRPARETVELRVGRVERNERIEQGGDMIGDRVLLRGGVFDQGTPCVEGILEPRVRRRERVREPALRVELVNPAGVDPVQPRRHVTELAALVHQLLVLAGVSLHGWLTGPGERVEIAGRVLHMQRVYVVAKRVAVRPKRVPVVRPHPAQVGKMLDQQFQRDRAVGIVMNRRAWQLLRRDDRLRDRADRGCVATGERLRAHGHFARLLVEPEQLLPGDECCAVVLEDAHRVRPRVGDPAPFLPDQHHTPPAEAVRVVRRAVRGIRETGCAHAVRIVPARPHRFDRIGSERLRELGRLLPVAARRFRKLAGEVGEQVREQAFAAVAEPVAGSEIEPAAERVRAPRAGRVFDQQLALRVEEHVPLLHADDAALLGPVVAEEAGGDRDRGVAGVPGERAAVQARRERRVPAQTLQPAFAREEPRRGHRLRVERSRVRFPAERVRQERGAAREEHAPAGSGVTVRERGECVRARGPIAPRRRIGDREPEDVGVRVAPAGDGVRVHPVSLLPGKPRGHRLRHGVAGGKREPRDGDRFLLSAAGGENSDHGRGQQHVPPGDSQVLHRHRPRSSEPLMRS
ncbi:MAG: hypothetical protein MAG453_00182 [Calditrichaeota bacterium]|nr:hypothetical protein [Calditrichota bacterium]